MEESGNARRYLIDVTGGTGRRKSLSVMIASRKCYQDQQNDAGEPLPETAPQTHINQIAKHCAMTSDYILPDTPIKEAIFRTLLAGGNRPMSADDISIALKNRWSMSAYPRELSHKVIGKILDSSESYCIIPVLEPEPKEVGAGS